MNGDGSIIFDPNPVDPTPTGVSFEVGDRIQIGQHIVTVTAVIPHEGDATEYRVTSDVTGVSPS